MLPTEPNTPPNSRIWRIIHFPLVTLLIGIAFYLLSAVAATFVSRSFPKNHNDPSEVALAVIVAALFAAGYIAFVRRIEQRPVTEFGLSGWWKELGAGLLGGAALFSLVLGLIALGGAYHIVGTSSLTVLYPSIALSIVSGVTEEIALRGLFFRIIERSLGSWIALAMSAALFGALHLGNPNATPLAGTAIALEAGIMLAALYMVTRRLWAAIGLHAAWNFTQGGVYGVSVSGIAQTGVLRPRIAGPDWLTGGAFGVEASLPAVVVCVGFGAALLVYAVRHDRIVKPFWARRL